MVKVTFKYDPEEPDDGDRTGMSNEEFERLHDSLTELGAEDIEMTKVTAE